MAGPIIAQLKDARIVLGGANLFSGVDIALSKGERIAFVGPNGAGKSTIMRILVGGLEPDGGERTLAAGATIAFVPQEPDLDGFATLLDYCVAGFASDAPLAKHECEAQLGAWGLDPARGTAGLSGGEIRRAALARAFAADPDLLLMDEPTNHLDIVAIEALEDRLRAFRGAALIVSHDRRFLERVSTVCLWLRNGAVRRLDKGYAQFEDWAVAIEAEEAKSLARLETQLAGEEHWFARGVTARRTRNEGRARRLADMRADRRQRKSLARGAKASIEAGKGADSGRLVIEARDVGRTFPGAERPIVRDVSIRVMRGDRVGIVGPNGAGKTTLLDMLLKNAPPTHGEVVHGANIELTYVDQARAIVDPSATIWDTLAPNGGDHISVRGRSRHVAAYAKDFLFKPEQLRQPVGALSGGERNRLALAVALARPANLIVLDEPTNDLDMDALDALEEALGAYDGTVIVVSHDRAFLDGVATQILGALGEGEWAETFGGVSDFEREHGRFRIRAEKGANRSAAPAAPRAEPAQRKLSYKDERRLAEIEGALPRLEQEIAKLESALADSNGFAADPAGFAAKAERLAKAKADKESSEAEWLILEGKREALTRS
jgi:ATP-binding cassette subfamily F protein uup